VREKEVGRQHRLRAAQVRVRRHDRVAHRLGALHQREGQGAQLLLDDRNPPPKVQAQVERHLLVSRAPRVQALSRVADALDQPPLDEAVDVLVSAIGSIVQSFNADVRADRLEAVDDGGCVGRREHAGGAQRLGPRHAARDVIVDQPPIEGERSAEREDVGVGAALEAA
jgi:hypothetical protein